MNNDDIFKKIIKNDSEKLIIVENGKPKFVVMSYVHYVRLNEKNGRDENFEMNFDELFAKSGSNKESVVAGDDKKIAERLSDVNANDISLDDLPVM